MFGIHVITSPSYQQRVEAPRASQMEPEAYCNDLAKRVDNGRLPLFFGPGQSAQQKAEAKKECLAFARSVRQIQGE